MGYLISETTKEEREAIVAESLGNIEANCDGCMSGLAEMYQESISTLMSEPEEDDAKKAMWEVE